MTNPDVTAARRLLDQTPLHNRSEQNLAAAQVHATLAVEQAVRDLIEVVRGGRGDDGYFEGAGS